MILSSKYKKFIYAKHATNIKIYDHNSDTTFEYKYKYHISINNFENHSDNPIFLNFAMLLLLTLGTKNRRIQENVRRTEIRAFGF